ncbi:thioesterase family protein [Rhodoligotrophos defluvii]|uniref:thioesterase family protein n=1 Tax=Rhodoligotrophos defluvii TaxID=2561934 RepID=UPI0010C953A1|nr:thioesterase family protein [Rhodoligotrophos defluvii]
MPVTLSSERPLADPRLPQHRLRVLPEWIDGNKHMNACYYLAIIKDPAMAVHDEWDYGTAFRARTNQSNFVLESQVVHLRELLLDDPILVATRITDLDDKRMHLLFEIYNDEKRYLAALAQYLVIHVNMGPPPKVAPIPPDLHQRLSAIRALHAQVPLPPGAERLQRLGSPRLGAFHRKGAAR